jgi:hypothetical protein
MADSSHRLGHRPHSLLLALSGSLAHMLALYIFSSLVDSFLLLEQRLANITHITRTLCRRDIDKEIYIDIIGYYRLCIP